MEGRPMSSLSKEDRGKVLLDAIYDEVDRRMNPNGDECWNCGGDGYIADCHEEWACIDPESGCEDCLRRCPECAIFKHNRLKAIREEVIKSGDIDIVREWLKSIGRWSDDITPERIQAELDKARLLDAASSEAADR
jgi:hypothetical protein